MQVLVVLTNLNVNCVQDVLYNVKWNTVSSLLYKLAVGTLLGSHVVIGRDVWSGDNGLDHRFSIV